MSKMTVPKPTIAKLPSIKQPKAPQTKGAGLRGYLKASKMQPLMKTIKSQLMP